MPGKHAYAAQHTSHRRDGAESVEVLVRTVERDPERARRIAELKDQIRKGTYRPNLEKVAERLLPELITPEDR